MGPHDSDSGGEVEASASPPPHPPPPPPPPEDHTASPPVAENDVDSINMQQPHISAQSAQTAVRTLILLRHAKSAWDDESLQDEHRALAPRGVRSAAGTGKKLAQNLKHTPSLVVCSTAARARETLAIVRWKWPDLLDATVRFDDRIYDDVHGAHEQLGTTTRRAIADALTHIPEAAEAKCVVIVGHNFGFEQATSELTRVSDVQLKTGAAAVLRLPGGAASTWGDALTDDACGKWQLVDVLRDSGKSSKTSKVQKELRKKHM